MKTNQTHLTPPPSIEFIDYYIKINDQMFTQSIVIDENWTITECDVKTAKDWANHPKRLDCIQIISYPGVIADPEIIDCFWQQMIACELLPLKPAIVQAKSLIADNMPFQLLLIPNINQAQDS